MPTVEQVLAAVMPVVQPIVAPGNGSNIGEIWRLKEAVSSTVQTTNDYGEPVASTATDTVIGDAPRDLMGTYAVRIAANNGSLSPHNSGMPHQLGVQSVPKGEFMLIFNAGDAPNIKDSDQVHIVAGVYNGAAGNKGKTGPAYRWFQIMDAGGAATEQVERLVGANEIR